MSPLLRFLYPDEPRENKSVCVLGHVFRRFVFQYPGLFLKNWIKAYNLMVPD